ncbi:sarcoplasmic calcium-binding protein-like [Liolophura sinensis]|uniref:sarcoplasmic calcium-binding protein-like n=1 Tax=Liolophura sinensis TaxID=3198878 RepID=UPI0031586CBD
MASLSEHLSQKWRKFFQFFDINKDGRWTRDDFEKFADRLVIQADSMLTEIGACHVRRHCQHWLSIHEEQLCGTGVGEITEQVICDTMARLLLLNNNNAGCQIKELDIFSEVWFEILDINRDGRISEGDMWILYKCMGVKNLTKVGELFRELDLDSDHHLTREEVRVGYRQYFFGEQRQDFQSVALLFDLAGLQQGGAVCVT